MTSVEIRSHFMTNSSIKPEIFVFVCVKISELIILAIFSNSDPHYILNLNGCVSNNLLLHNWELQHNLEV